MCIQAKVEWNVSNSMCVTRFASRNWSIIRNVFIKCIWLVVGSNVMWMNLVHQSEDQSCGQISNILHPSFTYKKGNVQCCKKLRSISGIRFLYLQAYQLIRSISIGLLSKYNAFLNDPLLLPSYKLRPPIYEIILHNGFATYSSRIGQYTFVALQM